MEEQWIDTIDNAGTASLSQSDPSSSSILQGILVGFFFPLLPFYYFREPKQPLFGNEEIYVESLGSVIFSYVFASTQYAFFSSGLPALQSTHADGIGSRVYSELFIWVMEIPLEYLIERGAQLDILSSSYSFRSYALTIGVLS